MRFLAYLLISLNICYVLYLNSEIHFQKDLVKMNHDFVLTVVKERDQARDQVKELSDSNYVLSEKAKYSQDQDLYVIDRCQTLWKRLEATTDIVESLARCSENGVSVEECFAGRGGNDLDLALYLQENRNMSF